MRRQPAGDEQHQKRWSFGPAYRSGTPASGRRHTVRRCTAEIREEDPCQVRHRNPSDLNLMIWNVAIYCALVVQGVVIVGLRRTLVLRARAKQGSCYAVGRITLRHKPAFSPNSREGRLSRYRAPGGGSTVRMSLRRAATACAASALLEGGARKAGMPGSGVLRLLRHELELCRPFGRARGGNGRSFSASPCCGGPSPWLRQCRCRQQSVCSGDHARPQS